MMEHIVAETKLLEIENHLLRLLKQIAPQLEPSEDLIGLYWQVDNYIAGQNQELTALKVEIEEINLKDRGKTNEINLLTKENKTLLALRDELFDRLAAKDALVREMIVFVQHCAFCHRTLKDSTGNEYDLYGAIIPSSDVKKAQKILNRPEVRAVMEEK